ncbi:hypothetical protein ABKN59_008336 [Abortiporus biennis]
MSDDTTNTIVRTACTVKPPRTSYILPQSDTAHTLYQGSFIPDHTVKWGSELVARPTIPARSTTFMPNYSMDVVSNYRAGQNQAATNLCSNSPSLVNSVKFVQLSRQWLDRPPIFESHLH